MGSIVARSRSGRGVTAVQPRIDHGAHLETCGLEFRNRCRRWLHAGRHQPPARPARLPAPPATLRRHALSLSACGRRQPRMPVPCRPCARASGRSAARKSPGPRVRGRDRQASFAADDPHRGWPPRARREDVINRLAFMRLIPRQSPNAQRGDTMRRKRRNWGKSPVCQGFQAVSFAALVNGFPTDRAALSSHGWRCCSSRLGAGAFSRPHAGRIVGNTMTRSRPQRTGELKIVVTNPLTVMVTNPLTMIKRTLPCPVFFDPPDR